MSSHLDPLRRVRVGCVRYLNARPLIEPFECAGGRVTLEHPSVLASRLACGELDVALVPIFEALRSPEFRIADGVAIASRGPVWSVFVAHQGPISDVTEVALDPASLTSANLCKVLFSEWLGTSPRYVPEPAPPGAARLMIGNQAIEFRARHGDAWRYLDLGEEWLRRTGLPFVFAAWLIRPEVENPGEIAAAFRALASEGIAKVPEIAASQPDPAFALRYLTEWIRFGLGDEEKAAIALFRALLIKHGQLSPADGAQPLVYV